MFHRYLSKMYEIPTAVYVILILIGVCLWAFLDARLKQKREWKTANLILFFLSLLAIFTITFFVRTTQKTGVYLDPRHVLESAKDFPDVYNQMMLNVVLFVPIGLTFPFAFRFGFAPLLAVITALFISFSVEFLQYTFSRGYFDTSDLILNVFGAFCGTLACFVSKHIKLKYSDN